MLATVTNTSGFNINYPEQGGYGRSPDAVGGSFAYALPYPFNGYDYQGGSSLGALAPGNHFTLGMHPEDWYHKDVPWQPQEPRTQWQQLVNAGIVSMSFATQTGVTDLVELFDIAVG